MADSAYRTGDEHPPPAPSAAAPVKIAVPHHYDIDEDVLAEMVERREVTTLLEKFGGIDGMAAKLDSDVHKGIKASSLVKRVEQFGLNELNKKEPVTFIEFLIDAFGDRIVQILSGAAIISIIFGMTLPNPHSGHVELDHGWVEGTAILISVMIVVLTGSINNYVKAKKFEEMEREQSVKKLQVFRDGVEQEVDSPDLAVGDLLVVETGMELCCDALFISGSDLKTNESPITGEPDLIEKDSVKDPFLVSGTSVDEGNGVVLVIAVGMGSFQGRLKQSLDAPSGDTPLQEHLEELANRIGRFGLAGAIVLFVALSIKEIVLILNNGKPASAISFLNFVLISITLIAVAIPEGLPLAVTIALSFSMNAMMNDNCMVRVLASCETMGAATAICSDKTGTLTTNQMTVVQGCICGQEFVISNYGLTERHEGVKVVDRDTMQLATSKALQSQFAFAVSINSTAREQVVDGVNKWTGNKTEFGLLGFINRMGFSYKDMRESVQRSSDMFRQFPFSSEKKRMTTVCRDDRGVLTAYIKGASEAILEQCDKYLDDNGSPVEMDPARRQLFETIINDMANQGNRTIGVARCQLESTMIPEEEPSVKFIFMGVLGIQDPIRPEVPDAVLACNSAGLTVRMVTGDNINTAIAIAKKCNIYQDNGFDVAMTGQAFRDTYREPGGPIKLKEMLPRLRVLARSSPNDKHILVGLLQDLGEVVGVTGDGTNDAPALKLANVGFAMKTGTDIAKGAADMVLLDDNFASVVNAIRWGRAVNDNVKKFLQFQLSINCAGVALTLVGSLASATSKEPFTPVQLLWLNMIMDTLAAIALATELPEAASLSRSPVYLQAPLITNRMRLFIGVHGIWQFVMIMVIMFAAWDWWTPIEGRDSVNKCELDSSWAKVAITVNGTTTFVESATTMACKLECTRVGGVLHGRKCQQGLIHSTVIFNTFIWSQIFNVFNSRKIYGEINMMEGTWDRSKNLMKVFGIIVALQVLAVEVALDFMGCTHLRWSEWLACIAVGAVEIPLGFLVRLVPVEDSVPEVIVDRIEGERKLRALHDKSRRKSIDPSLARGGASRGSFRR